MPRPIDPASPLTRLHRHQTRMSCLPNFDIWKHIRVWLVELVGWPAPHIPIFLRSSLSFRCTAASQLPVTCVQPFTLSITFILLTTMELPSRPQTLHSSISMFTFRTLCTYRLTLMLFLPLEQNVHLSHLIAMLVGDLRLALPFVTGLSFLSSNLGVRVVVSFFDRVGRYHGCVLDRIRLPSARVKPKSAPQMKLPN
jgi:hypothetical protein